MILGTISWQSFCTDVAMEPSEKGVTSQQLDWEGSKRRGPELGKESNSSVFAPTAELLMDLAMTKNACRGQILH